MESYRKEGEEIYSGPIAPVDNTEGEGNVTGSLTLTDFRLYYSNQNILVQAQKEKYRPMEQYRKSREKLIHVCPPMTKKARMYNGAQSFQ